MRGRVRQRHDARARWGVGGEKTEGCGGGGGDRSAVAAAASAVEAVIGWPSARAEAGSETANAEYRSCILQLPAAAKAPCWRLITRMAHVFTGRRVQLVADVDSTGRV